MSASKVIPCTACGRPTRPTKSLIAEYPGTMGRYGDRCMTCHRNEAQRTIGPQSVENIVSGLERFLRARREREAAMKRREYITERISA